MSDKIAMIRGFVSLQWYDELIDFLFKFVAKTSEPLLAAGLVVSAADFLSDGQVMAGNAQLAGAWAWTQAVAIETSAGVTLVYACQSFGERDRAKAWLYIGLATLLSIVGAIMLFLQLMAHTEGIPETRITSQVWWLPIVMAALRSIVAIGYVVMCRTKRIRFSGQDEIPTTPPETPAPSISDETMQLILNRLSMLDTLEQRLQVSIEMATQPQLPTMQVPQIAESAESREPTPILNGTDSGTGPEPMDEPREEAGVEARLMMAFATLKAQGPFTVEDLRGLARCRKKTAGDWLKQQLEREVQTI